MMPGGGDWDSQGGYQPIIDPIAHIDVPAETADDRVWSQDINGLWGNLTKELSKACYTGNAWRVKHLLDLKHKAGKDVDINKVVKHEDLNQVALSYAVSKKNYKIIDLLMCSGASLFAAKRGGSTAIDRAAEEKDAKIWNILLKNSEMLELVISSVSKRKDASELCVLRKSLVELYPDQPKLYRKLPTKESDPTAGIMLPTESIEPTAHIKIPEATPGDLEWAKSMEGKWKRGLSQELAKVSCNGYIWRVKHLLDLKNEDGSRKVDVYKTTFISSANYTPLCHAMKKMQYKVIELLLSAGVDPNKSHNTMKRAIYEEDEEVWKMLFKHGFSVSKAVDVIRKTQCESEVRAFENALGEVYPEQLENYGFEPLKKMLPPTEDSETEVTVKPSEEQEMPALVQDKTEITDINLSKEWERVTGSDDEIVHTSRIESTGIVKQAIFNFKERSVTMLFQTNGVMATPVIRNFKDIEGEDSLFEAYNELEKQGAKPPVFLGQNLVTVGKNTPNKKRVTFSQK